MNNIIDLLRDDNNYYGDIGRKYMSNSDIGNLLSNPKAFGIPRQDNATFGKGRLFHQCILEPEKAKDFLHLDCSSRNSKKYKDYIAENNLPFVLLTKEYNDILGSVEAMLGNWDFFTKIREEGVIYEEPSVKEIHGKMWKGKADIITDTHIYDLKTTNDMYKFKWSASKYNYDSQAFIYQQLFGRKMDFLVIDKNTNLLGHFTTTDEFIERGEEKVRRAVEVYDKYFGDDPTDDIESFYLKDVL